VSDIPHFRPLPAASLSAGWSLKPLTDRLRGPGGYYNVGNVLGLVMSLATQFALAAPASGTRSGLDILVGYFAGSPSAVALTAATIVFLVSGEMYHRAWVGRAVPDPAINAFADVLSAIGCLALTISLIFLDQWFLAIASGLLSVGGKLGSALFGDDSARLGFWPTAWVDPFRAAVLVGRAPAVAAAGFDLGFRLFNWTGGSVWTLAQPIVLLLCYMLWIKADLLLVIGARATTIENQEASHARTL
jgi:hypothetical protein